MTALFADQSITPADADAAAAAAAGGGGSQFKRSSISLAPPIMASASTSRSSTSTPSLDHNHNHNHDHDYNHAPPLSFVLVLPSITRGFRPKTPTISNNYPSPSISLSSHFGGGPLSSSSSSGLTPPGFTFPRVGAGSRSSRGTIEGYPFPISAADPSSYSPGGTSPRATLGSKSTSAHISTSTGTSTAASVEAAAVSSPTSASDKNPIISEPLGSSSSNSAPRLTTTASSNHLTPTQYSTTTTITPTPTPTPTPARARARPSSQKTRYTPPTPLETRQIITASLKAPLSIKSMVRMLPSSASARRMSIGTLPMMPSAGSGSGSGVLVGLNAWGDMTVEDEDGGDEDAIITNPGESSSSSSSTSRALVQAQAHTEWAPEEGMLKIVEPGQEELSSTSTSTSNPTTNNGAGSTDTAVSNHAHAHPHGQAHGHGNGQPFRTAPSFPASQPSTLPIQSGPPSGSGSSSSTPPPPFGSKPAHAHAQAPARKPKAKTTGRRTTRRPQTSGAALPTVDVPRFGHATVTSRKTTTETNGTTDATSVSNADTNTDTDATTTPVNPSSTGTFDSLDIKNRSDQDRSSSPRPSGQPHGVASGEKKWSAVSNIMTGRPGWEGEEMVKVLREDGMEVTTLRAASQIPNHIGPGSHNNPSATNAFPNKSAQQKQKILLVPLSDSPTLPSLSLLLAQGTTPSAVCFQQDLLERARRTEADWLPSALDMIWMATYAQKTHEYPSHQIAADEVLVVAYSANPALSDSVVEQCLQAGAIGVLQPPYERQDTLAKIRTMVIAPPERRASVISLLSKRSSIDPTNNSTVEPAEPPQQVVRMPSLSSAPLSAVEHSHVQARKGLTTQLALYDLVPRRRSVDTGGLALALHRATGAEAYETKVANASLGIRAMDINSVGNPHPLRTDRSASLADANLAGLDISRIRQQDNSPDDGQDTYLAELLGEMYRQTREAIEIQMVDYEEFSAPLLFDHRSKLIQDMSTWDFKPHALNDADLFRCACLLFEAVLRVDGLFQLGIQRDQLNRLLFAIRAIYHAPNPYHNYVHAIDVLQASYSFLRRLEAVPPLAILLDPLEKPWKSEPLEATTSPEDDNARAEVRKILRPQDVLCVMIAAMGHDVGHPGLSNVFMKNAKTPLSQVYDDKSVLENMHCMLMVQLLRKHGFGFLLGHSSKTGNASEIAMSSDDPLPSPSPIAAEFRREVLPGAVSDWKGFKKLLYSSVLATDMSLHFDWIKRFLAFAKGIRAGDLSAQVQAGNIHPEEYRHLMEEGRVLLCQSIIKCADISNPTRPIEVSMHWSSVLLQEWANQASLEKELNIPISTVASADAALQAKGQIGFIDLFTQPLFEAATEAMPDLQPYATFCATNRALWQVRLDAAQKIAEATASAPEIVEEGSRSSVLPDIPNTSIDARFATLFPLSLPLSLLSSSPSQNYNIGTGTADLPTPTSSASLSQAPFGRPTSSNRSPSSSSDRLIHAHSDTFTDHNAAVRAVYRGVLRREPSSRSANA